MHFPGLDSQNYWKICPKSPPADQNLNFRTPGPFFNHALAFLPIPSPPKYRSQPEISISSPDSSNYLIPYQKVSKVPPNPDFPRFTNKKPVRGMLHIYCVEARGQSWGNATDQFEARGRTWGKSRRFYHPPAGLVYCEVRYTAQK